jgi:hypothetical protein
MELVNGGDLFDYIIRCRRLSMYIEVGHIGYWLTNNTAGEEHTADLTAQLCDAMAVRVVYNPKFLR